MESNASFALDADTPYTITPKRLAQMVAEKTGEQPPVAETIRNHVKRGSITACKKIGFRTLYAPEAVAQYIANAPKFKHGGRRTNAGRRKAPSPPSELTKDAADAQAVAQRITQRYADDQRPINGIMLDEVLRFTRAELTVLERIGLDTVGLTNTAIDRMAAIQRLQREELSLAEKRGELVKVEEIADAWTESLQIILTEMAALPKRAADTMASVAWISDQTVDQLCSLLHHQGVDSDLIDDTRAMLARPADHGIKIRTMLTSHVHAIRESIATQPPVSIASER